MTRRFSLLKLLIGGTSAALFALAAILTAQIASAHSRPVRFDPAPGSVLTAAPSKVDGWFTAELRRDPNWNFIRVTDAQGNRVDTGEPVLSSDRRQMSVSLRSGVLEGRYLVTWRSWDDADGAIFGDCYTFFVGQQAADAAVNDKTRLDGGRDCQRIDVSAREGTPVAGGTPQAQATAPAGDAHGDEVAAGEPEAEEGDGIPLWGLVLGVVAGAVVGGLGGRFLGSRD
jgi:methionine-rich copper-binding protein CopC